ncbi:YybH family protein [Paracoccus pacificus]|uniref:YybH family protein n=1 Tax=Paracoccus pacificus TaxID=1463598 RepID=A0ABW4R2I0_9RHOB
MSATFDAFMKSREAAARAYVSGDASPVLALSATDGQATFFDPGGGFTEGAEAVNRANRDGAAMFGPAGTTRFEIHDKAESGDLAFWTGYQIAEVELAGKPGKIPMKLRITEVFRRDGDDWRMIHRHASMAKDS